MENYWGYLFEQISLKNKHVYFSGINLCKMEKSWGVPVFVNNEGRYYFFNGVGDTVTFPVSDTTYYYPTYHKADNMAGYNRIIEYFRYKDLYFLPAGFIWYHLKFADIREENVLWAGTTPIAVTVSENGCVGGSDTKACMEFKTFMKLSLKDLIRLRWIDFWKYTCKAHLFYFSFDKNLPDPEIFIKRNKI